MSGDAHVRFWESEGAQVPLATHPFGNPVRKPISDALDTDYTLSVGGVPLSISAAGDDVLPRHSDLADTRAARRELRRLRDLGAANQRPHD